MPGARARCRVAPSAVAVRRGSATISAPPASRWDSKYRISGGMVSAGFAPTSRMASAWAMSSTGNGRPRSMPNARLRGGRGRGHAEPAVVVDARGPERHPGELAQEIGLLVGEGAASENADRVRPVPPARALDRFGDAAERVFPAHGTKDPAGITHERSGEPLGVGEEPRGRPALDAKGPSVHRKPRVSREHRGVRRPREVDPALQRAVGTMALHGPNQWT